MIVGIADSLTLDHSLKLSLLFNLPPSFSDYLYRVSLSESPGLKFLEEIKHRNIINMYDMTNLQKAFKMLELDKVDFELVTPYQEKLDDEQYALHKAKERYTWTGKLDIFKDVNCIFKYGAEILFMNSLTVSSFYSNDRNLSGNCLI